MEIVAKARVAMTGLPLPSNTTLPSSPIFLRSTVASLASPYHTTKSPRMPTAWLPYSVVPPPQASEIPTSPSELVVRLGMRKRGQAFQTCIWSTRL